MASVPNRRAFLTTAAGAALLGATGLPGTARAQEQAQGQAGRDPFGEFVVGVQSYTFRNFPLERTLDQVRDLGLHYVELFRGHLPTTATEEQIRAVRTQCHERNITPIAFGVERFTADHAANRRLFEFARKLGARYLSADPTPDSFDSLDRLVREFDIAIAIHPHGPVGNNRLHPWYKAEVILPAVRDHDRRIGTCLDTGHLIRTAQAPFNERLDPAAQVRQMGARNFGLHLKDHDNERRTDVVFGRGVLDVPGVLRALREVRFTGYISIEYEANPDNPTPDVRACLDAFRTAARNIGA